MQITQQPEATPGVEGQKLVLECRATGVPKPNFLWFMEPDTPLPEYTSDRLEIPRLSKGDAGRYCCRAENEVNTVFSPWVEVKVQKPYILNNGNRTQRGGEGRGKGSEMPTNVSSPKAVAHMWSMHSICPHTE